MDRPRHPLCLPHLHSDGSEIHLEHYWDLRGAENKKQFEIPLYEKPFLSIEEASVYTGIGRDKLYELTNPEDCPFVLWIGNRRMIKRRVFDEYIEKCYSI